MLEPIPEHAAEAAAVEAADLVAAVVAIDRPAATSCEGLHDGAEDGAPEIDPIESLPAHARGVLQILVPVTVILAAQRKSVQEIIELGPGAIVKFDKTYDQPLVLSVGSRAIASGEVVKVGDKFGLRIRRLVKSGETL